jgi:hypothetical protein
MDRWNTDFDTENTLDGLILEDCPDEPPNDPKPLVTLYRAPLRYHEGALYKTLYHFIGQSKL